MAKLTYRNLTLLGATLICTALAFAPTDAQANDLSEKDAQEETIDNPWGLSPLRLAPELQTAGTHKSIAQTRRRRYYKRRYYRYRRSPRVHYYNRAQVTIVPDDPPRRIVVDPPLRSEPWYGASLVVRTVGLSYGDNRLAQGSLDGDDLAGFGMGLRMNLDRHWGLEFAVDFVGGRGDFYDVASMPTTASLFARLFPESVLDLYGLAGGGVYFTEYNYHAAIPNDAYMLIGGHVGGGAELKLGHFLVTGDVRAIAVQNPPTAINIQRTAPSTTRQALTESSSPRAQIVRDETEEKWRKGLGFTLGVGYRW